MTDILARLFFMMGCYLGYCIARLWEVPWKDFTQTETQIAHKATAEYGLIVYSLPHGEYGHRAATLDMPLLSPEQYQQPFDLGDVSVSR